jgi:hypothetical protein
VYGQKVVIWRNWKLMIWRHICDTMACAWLAIRPLFWAHSGACGVS